MEIELLRLLSTLSIYTKYNIYIKRSTVSKEVYIILQDYSIYYKETKKDTINFSEFNTWFRTIRHPSYGSEKLDIFSSILSRASELEEPDSDIILHGLIQRDYATQIANTSLAIAEGDSEESISVLKNTISEFEDVVGKTKDIRDHFVTDDWDEILDHVKGGTGLNWRLMELNMSAGPVRGGDFIIIASRPDTGKTTMLASEATFMAWQMEEKDDVVWFNNEEEGRKVKSRIFQAALGKSLSWIDENREKAKEDYIKTLGSESKIKVFDNKRMTVQDCEAAIETACPRLIIFDQLWKVRGFEKEATNDVDRITRLFAWAREIAAVYNATVITVHQADATAHGQEYIEMNQLYMSKTGLQGEADCIITLGRALGEDDKGYGRGLYVPKNKLVGGVHTKEEFRNGKFEIKIKPDIARFVGEF